MGVLMVLFWIVADWGCMVGILYLAALCFGLAFDLLPATGIWSLYRILRAIEET